MTTLSGAGTRALLIGTQAGSEEYGLPPVPAVGTTLADLRTALIQRCGMSPEQVTVVLDPRNPSELGLIIADEAENTAEALLVYYVGHGLVSSGGELYLATLATDSRHTRLVHTSLAYSAIRDSLLDSRAKSIIVILDCCFSGRAIGVLNDSSSYVADLTQVHGGCVLTSAAWNELALAPPGARHTAFSGEVIQLLNEGDPQGPPELTLRDAFKYLSRVLPAQGYPRPHQRVSEWIEDLVLAPNPAFRAPTVEDGRATGPSSLGANSAERTKLLLESLKQRRYRLQYVPNPGALTGFREFLDSGSRVYAVKGPSGSGKSRLVSHLAEALGREVDFQLHALDSWDITSVDLATEILRYASITPGEDPLLGLEGAAARTRRPLVVMIDAISSQAQLDRIGRQIDSILRQVTVRAFKIVLAIRTPPDVRFSALPVLAASLFEPSVQDPGTSYRVATWDARTAREAWALSRTDDDPSFVELPAPIQNLARVPLYMELLKSATDAASLRESNAFRLLDHCVRSIMRVAGRDVEQAMEVLQDLAQSEMSYLIPTQLLSSPPEPSNAGWRADDERLAGLTPLVENTLSGRVVFGHDLIREYALATRIAQLMIAQGRSGATVAALNELALQSTTSAMARGLFEFTVYAIDDHAPELAAAFALAPTLAVTTALPIMLRLARAGAQFANNEVLIASARRCTRDEAIEVARSLLAIPNVATALGEAYASWVMNVLERFGARIWPDVVDHLETSLHVSTLEQLLATFDLGKPVHAIFLARHFYLFTDGSAHQTRLLDGILGHGDWRVRAAMAESLGQADTWDESLAVRIADRLVTDEDYKVRAAAARSVGRLSGAHLWPMFGTLLTDPNWHVRASIIDGLLESNSAAAAASALEIIGADHGWTGRPKRAGDLLSRLTLLHGGPDAGLDGEAGDRALRRLLRERRTGWTELGDDVVRRLVELGLRSANWLTRREAKATDAGATSSSRGTEFNPRETYRRLRGGRALQVALDLHDLDQAVVVAAAAATAGADFIEVGDPLIKAAGVGALERIRQVTSGALIVAEMMSADWGRDQVELAVESGADVVFLIGPASGASVAAAALAGRQLGVPILLDVPVAQMTQSWVQEMERAGVDGFCVTTNIDQGIGGQQPLGKARAVRSWTRLPVAVSGGFSMMDRPIIGSSDWDIIIVGRSISEAVEPEEAARQMVSMVRERRG